MIQFWCKIINSLEHRKWLYMRYKIPTVVDIHFKFNQIIDEIIFTSLSYIHDLQLKIEKFELTLSFLLKKRPIDDLIPFFLGWLMTLLWRESWLLWWEESGEGVEWDDSPPPPLFTPQNSGSVQNYLVLSYFPQP